MRFISTLLIIVYCLFVTSVGRAERNVWGPSEVEKNLAKIQKETVMACLILEAGGERPLGMDFVLHVIKNRSGGSKKIEDWYKVVTKKNQFSCFNDGIDAAVLRAKKHGKWLQASSIVDNINESNDGTLGATHYHVFMGKSKVTPYWTHPKYGGVNKKAIVCREHGGHVFLKNVD